MVELCRLEGGGRLVVLSEGVTRPGALVLHPTEGLMFFADGARWAAY